MDLLGTSKLTAADQRHSTTGFGHRASSFSTIFGRESARKSVHASKLDSSRFSGIYSRYDAALAKNYDAKLYSNKVYPAWYKRYVNIVPECNISIQPFDEVQKRDEDIALQHFHGSGYHAYQDCREDILCRHEREATLRRYNLLKRREEERKYQATKTTSQGFTEDTAHRTVSVRSIIMATKARQADYASMFGASITQRAIMEPIIKFMQVLRQKRARLQNKKPLPQDSLWRIFQNPLIRNKIAARAKDLKRAEVRGRFNRVIQLVRCVQRFINVISTIAGDTKIFLKRVRYFQTSQAEKDKKVETKEKAMAGESVPYRKGEAASGSGGEEQLGPTRLMGRTIFDPTKYRIKQQVFIPLDIKLTLTKPWFERTDSEIENAVKHLCKLRSFMAYPVKFQKHLAKVAWWIEVQEQRVIIRQGQMATNFYFIIGGRVRLERLEGEPSVENRNCFTLLKICKMQDCFGDECITRPDSLRDYSVTTESRCELLSITSSEFQEMVMTRGEQEEAPEHIRFISQLAFLANFPKKKLIDEAEENISLYHFVPGTVVSKDLEKSDFVYVISSGLCQVLAEKKPKPAMIAKYELKKKEEELANRAVAMPRGARMSTVEEMMLRYKQAVSKSMDEGLVNRKSVFENMTKGSNDRLLHLASEEMIKRSVQLEFHRASVLAESRSLQMKTKRIEQSLPTAVKNKLFAGQVPSYFDSTTSLTTTQKTEGTSSASLAHSPSGAAHSPSVAAHSPSVAAHSPSVAVSERLSVIPTTDNKRESQDFHRTVVFDLDEKEPAPDPQASRRSRKRSVFTGTNIDTQNPESVWHLLVPQEKHIKMIPRAGDSAGLKEKPIPDPDIKCSQWILKRTLYKGDVVGVEYLDYKDGRYDPPTETWSLISKDATIISVRKSFLLENLRKMWW